MDAPKKRRSQITVLIFVESRYQVNRKRIKLTLRNFLEHQGITGPAEVSVAIVGDRKMKEMNTKHRGINSTTNVLSFSLLEGYKVNTPGEKLRLGDIIMSYPQIIRDASQEHMLVDEKIDELLVHSARHLLGMHHA